MNTRKIISFFLVIAMAAALLAGCGSSAKGSYTTSAPAYAEEYYEAEAPMAANGDFRSESASDNGDASVTLPEGRKWIVTVNMATETEDLDGMLTAVNRKVNELQGYIESQNIRNGSNYASRRYRSADLTVRIPVERLSDFTAAVQGISNVVTNSQSAQDVTLNYVDTESRLAALKIEEERLLDLLSKCETMTDMLEIESRLTDVRYEVERYGSKLRTMDNQIDFATIYLSIEEVKEYTPVVEKTFLQKITEGFMSSLSHLGEGFVDFAAWLIINLPYFVVYGVIVAVIVIVVRKSRKAIKARRQKKAEKAAAEAAARYAAYQAAQAQQETPAEEPKAE